MTFHCFVFTFILFHALPLGLLYSCLLCSNPFQRTCCHHIYGVPCPSHFLIVFIFTVYMPSSSLDIFTLSSFNNVGNKFERMNVNYVVSPYCFSRVHVVFILTVFHVLPSICCFHLHNYRTMSYEDRKGYVIYIFLQIKYNLNIFCTEIKGMFYTVHLLFSYLYY